MSLRDRCGRALAAAAVLATAVPFLAFVPPAAAAPTETTLLVSGASTYAVDIAAGVVRVRVELDLTNTGHAVTRGNIIETPYFSKFTIPVQEEAANIVASNGSRNLSVAIDGAESENFNLATADLSPNLFPGSQHISFTYDLPDQPPRSPALTRINAAFVSFIAFPIGDEGKASMTLVLPSSLDAEFVPIQPKHDPATDLPGISVYTYEAIADPSSFAVAVNARDDSQLVEREVDLDEANVVVRGWADDAPWADFVSGQIETGIPDLSERIGIEWPLGTTELSLLETVSPYLYGYAGWYRPDDKLVEIGDELDGEVVLHELSHVWFNSDLIASRWVNEGLAQVYANAALGASGGETTVAVGIDTMAPGAQALNDWTTPNVQDPDARAIELWGYNASYSIVQRLVDEIGEDGMRAVLAEADADHLPYLGDGEAETLVSDVSWRQFLDYLQITGDSTDVIELFTAYVLSDADKADLAERTEARTAYGALVAAGDGWTPPYEVRKDLSLWRFDRAGDSMAEATDLLERRDALTASLAPIDVALPSALEGTYESAPTLAEVFDALEMSSAAAEVLVDAHETVDAGQNPIAMLGLLGADHHTSMDVADAAFVDGKTDAMRVATAHAVSTVDGAMVAGLLRLGGILSFLGAGGLTARWRVRRKRRGEGEPPVFGPPLPDGFVRAEPEPLVPVLQTAPPEADS